MARPSCLFAAPSPYFRLLSLISCRSFSSLLLTPLLASSRLVSSGLVWSGLVSSLHLFSNLLQMPSNSCLTPVDHILRRLSRHVPNLLQQLACLWHLSVQCSPAGIGLLLPVLLARTFHTCSHQCVDAFGVVTIGSDIDWTLPLMCLRIHVGSRIGKNGDDCVPKQIKVISKKKKEEIKVISKKK